MIRVGVISKGFRKNYLPKAGLRKSKKKINPKSLDYLVSLQVCFKGQKYSEAISLCLAQLKTIEEKLGRENHYWMICSSLVARTYILLNRPEDAEAHALETMALIDQKKELFGGLSLFHRLTLMEVYRDLSRLDLAKKIMEMILKDIQDHEVPSADGFDIVLTNCYNQCARLCLQIHDFQKGEELAHRGLDLCQAHFSEEPVFYNHKYQDLFISLAACQGFQGKKEEFTQTVAKINPDDYPLLFLYTRAIGTRNFDNRQLEDAYWFFNQAISLDDHIHTIPPEELGTCHLIANGCLLQLGRYPEAENHARKALNCFASDRENQNPMAVLHGHLMLAQSLLHQNRIPIAMPSIEIALKIATDLKEPDILSEIKELITSHDLEEHFPGHFF